MTTPQEIGERIRAARLEQGYGVKNAAEAADLARDTWYRIEAGKPVQDAKRHQALRFLSLDADGLPKGERVDEPVTPLNLDPRLNNIERQIDALWRRLDELGGTADVPQTDADLVPQWGRTSPTPQDVPELPADLAADDPGEISFLVGFDDEQSDNEGR